MEEYGFRVFYGTLNMGSSRLNDVSVCYRYKENVVALQ
jgi:hypothetical protein